MSTLWSHTAALRDNQKVFLAIFALVGYGGTGADTFPAYYVAMSKKAAKAAALVPAPRAPGRKLYRLCEPCVICAGHVSLPRSVWLCVWP